MLSTAPLLETSLDGLTLHRRGKVRDIYELGDRLLIVATDRISAFDYVLGSGIPDKGKVLTQLSAFWFERMRRSRAESPALDRRRRRSRTRRGRTPTCCAAARCSCAGPSRCRSSASRAATCRARAGRTTRRPARSAASSCRPGCANRIGCRSRSSRRRPRPRAATTSTSARHEAGALVGAASRSRGSRR